MGERMFSESILQPMEGQNRDPGPHSTFSEPGELSPKSTCLGTVVTSHKGMRSAKSESSVKSLDAIDLIQSKILPQLVPLQLDNWRIQFGRLVEKFLKTEEVIDFIKSERADPDCNLIELVNQISIHFFENMLKMPMWNLGELLGRIPRAINILEKEGEALGIEVDEKVMQLKKNLQIIYRPIQEKQFKQLNCIRHVIRSFRNPWKKQDSRVHELALAIVGGEPILDFLSYPLMYTEEIRDYVCQTMSYTNFPIKMPQSFFDNVSLNIFTQLKSFAYSTTTPYDNASSTYQSPSCFFNNVNFGNQPSSIILYNDKGKASYDLAKVFRKDPIVLSKNERFLEKLMSQLRLRYPWKAELPLLKSADNLYLFCKNYIEIETAKPTDEELELISQQAVNSKNEEKKLLMEMRFETLLRKMPLFIIPITLSQAVFSPAASWDKFNFAFDAPAKGENQDPGMKIVPDPSFGTEISIKWDLHTHCPIVIKSKRFLVVESSISNQSSSSSSTDEPVNNPIAIYQVDWSLHVDLNQEIMNRKWEEKISVPLFEIDESVSLQKQFHLINVLGDAMRNS